MILGKLTLGETALHTHNDSYILEGIKAVSTSRPFLSSSVMVSALAAIFGIGFADILYVSELIALGTAISVSLILGLKVGQLRLISRDLAGAQATDAIYGTYAHLNRERRKIASAVERVKTGGAS